MAATYPMRFGLLQMSPVPSGKWWRDRARQVEQLGFSTLLLSDHFDRSPVAPLAAMSAAAAATDRLIVGTLVLNNDLRHPAVLAKELATIVLLSDGRLEVGIGAGWMTADYRQIGTEAAPASRRIHRLEEAVGMLRALLHEKEVTHHGDHYRLESMHPVPVRVGSQTRILIGGGGPRILALAGRAADIVSINWNVGAGTMGLQAISSGTPEATDEKLGWVRAAAAGRPLELHLQCYLLRITDRPLDAVSTWLRSIGAEAADPVVVARSPHILVGSENAVLERMEEIQTLWGVSYLSFYDKALFEAAPLIERFHL
jgi:probable F420-dependent oxidoreductase